MSNILTVCLIFASVVLTVNSARILGVFPCPSFSHQIVFRPIINELAKIGHELVILTTDPQRNASNKNIKEIDWSGAYKLWDTTALTTKSNSKYYVLSEIREIFDKMDSVTDFEMNHPEVQNLIHSDEKFDLIILEYLFPAMIGFAAKFQAPYVGIVSMDAPAHMHMMVGNPTNPVVYPDFQLPFKPPLNFIQRVISVGASYLTHIFGLVRILPVANMQIQKYFGDDTPHIMEISKNISMLFINTNPILHTIRPLGPTTIQIGPGIHMMPLKTLPKDISDFMDKAKNGVIYFSFGTNVLSSSIDPQFLKLLLDTFKDLPYHVLWKFDGNVSEISDNVKIIKWGPQQDILRHPNIKLFIMQGGLQSIEESIFSHVPMVCIPFFGDQEGNAANMIENKRIGLQLDRKTLDKATLAGSIFEVIQNPQYKHRVKEIAELLVDQQATGVEKAVWWIEYVIRHKGAYHLRNPAFDLPIYQYYLLDVITFLAIAISLPLYLFYRLLKWMITICIKRKKEKVQ